jgi:hypothetical protein
MVANLRGAPTALPLLNAEQRIHTGEAAIFLNDAIHPKPFFSMIPKATLC